MASASVTGPPNQGELLDLAPQLSVPREHMGNTCDLSELKMLGAEPKISVVIPAKNEEQNLRRTIERVLKLSHGQSIPFEIILVDDGSSDATSNISQRMACNDSRVVSIRNDSNYGKGFSLRKGFGLARGDLIVTIDADGQHPPEEIPKLLKPILEGEADFVLGSRFLDGYNDVPLRHKIGNKVVSSCFNMVFRSGFSDVLLGMRAFRRTVLDDMKLKFNGYLVEVELLANMMKKAARIVEVPTRCVYTKKSPILRGVGIVGKIVIGLLLMRIVHGRAEH